MNIVKNKTQMALMVETADNYCLVCTELPYFEVVRGGGLTVVIVKSHCVHYLLVNLGAKNEIDDR